MTKTEVSKTALIIVSSCSCHFQDGINVFQRFRLAQLVQKIAEALMNIDADPRLIGQVQVNERLEHNNI